MSIRLIKENKKGKNYVADGFDLFYRYKNTISGDNSENMKEKIYLITGSAEVTIKNSVKVIKAPSKIYRIR
jgi:hypothetical protein